MSQFLFCKEKARPVPSPRGGRKKLLNEGISAILGFSVFAFFS
jgi:hypothetical protein